ncbi:MAG: nucleoside deaminase [Gemmatimonadales bacterium]
MGQTEVRVTLPDWVDRFVEWDCPYPSDEDRMRLAIALARENAERGTGGPFGAAVFERDSHRLVAVGVNRVIGSNNSMLHAEMVAFMLAQQRVGSYTLGEAELPTHELVTSSEPCAMCLGAVLWSGVRRVVSGATWEDARKVGFEEGPVFPESFRFLEKRGVTLVRGVLRDEAAEVLRDYLRRGGTVYNG